MRSNLKSPHLSERREIRRFLLFTIFAILMFKFKSFPQLPTEPLSMPCGSPPPPHLCDWLLEWERLWMEVEGRLSNPPFCRRGRRIPGYWERVSGPGRGPRSLDLPANLLLLHVQFNSLWLASSDSPGLGLLFSPRTIVQKAAGQYSVWCEDKNNPTDVSQDLSFLAALNEPPFSSQQVQPEYFQWGKSPIPKESYFIP